MAVKGLTGYVRAPREARIKLGYLQRGKKFPGDTDVFVGKVADGITEEMIAAYGATPIEDAAEAGVYNFGRGLRGMLKFEFDQVAQDGREVVFESLNRAWGKSRIRCSGDGGDGGENAGEAWVRDEQYATRLRRAGLLGAERAGGGWHAQCHGKDCPLWHAAATDADKTPACHRETRFRFMLLHPATMDRRVSLDQQGEDYLRQLGWVEIATGSWNGTVDITSGMRVLQAAAAGRTTFIPFTLKRKARSISAPTGRVVKSTLMLTDDADEVQVFALGDPARAQLRPAMRRQMLELLQAEAGLAALPPPTYADVADIQPQPERRALPAPSPRPPAAPVAGDRDRDEAIASARRSDVEADNDEPAGQAPPERVRRLGSRDKDDLKRLCGGEPGKPDTLRHYFELVEASYHACQVPADDECTEWIAYPGRRPGAAVESGRLTTRHRAWIEERLAEEQSEPAGDPGDTGDDQS